MSGENIIGNTKQERGDGQKVGGRKDGQGNTWTAVRCQGEGEGHFRANGFRSGYYMASITQSYSTG